MVLTVDYNPDRVRYHKIDRTPALTRFPPVRHALQSFDAFISGFHGLGQADPRAVMRQVQELIERINANIQALVDREALSRELYREWCTGLECNFGIFGAYPFCPKETCKLLNESRDLLFDAKKKFARARKKFYDAYAQMQTAGLAGFGAIQIPVAVWIITGVITALGLAWAALKTFQAKQMALMEQAKYGRARIIHEEIMKIISSTGGDFEKTKALLDSLVAAHQSVQPGTTKDNLLDKISDVIDKLSGNFIVLSIITVFIILLFKILPQSKKE